MQNTYRKKKKKKKTLESIRVCTAHKEMLLWGLFYNSCDSENLTNIAWN